MRSTTDVEPHNIRDIVAISKNKGGRRDWRNETDQSNPVLALTLTLIGATSMTHPSVAQAQAT
jgi:hypothetical protein